MSCQSLRDRVTMIDIDDMYLVIQVPRLLRLFFHYSLTELFIIDVWTGRTTITTFETTYHESQPDKWPRTEIPR